MPHDLAVLAGAGLGLVGIDDEVVRPPVRLLRHERPFEAGREAGAAAAAQARGLDLVDDAVAALLQDRLGAVPGAARPRAFEAPVVQAVEVLEDAVLVGEHVDALRDLTFAWCQARSAAAVPARRPRSTPPRAVPSDRVEPIRALRLHGLQPTSRIVLCGHVALRSRRSAGGVRACRPPAGGSGAGRSPDVAAAPGRLAAAAVPRAHRQRRRHCRDRAQDR